MTARKHPSTQPADSAQGQPPSDGGAPAVERLSRLMPEAPRRKRASGVLSLDDFEWFLERERSLADRCNRVFSLLVVRPVRAEPGDFQTLARVLISRLRATDLVGQLQGGALAMLLADTHSEGAMVVAASVDRAVTKLGIHVESTIYVYPSVDEDRDDAAPGADGRTPGNGHASGNGKRRARGGNGKARTPRPTGTEPFAAATPAESSNGGPAHPAAPSRPSASAVAAPDERWPMHDLWTRLSLPLPVWKRLLDVLLSGIALLLLLPLFAFVAIAIRLDSPGPILFTQKRAGRAAKPFTLYKFRSMVSDAEKLRPSLQQRNEQSGPVFKIRDDPRITRFGHWLRRWSIDELPQLWNVLKGDISLVGPRSPTFEELSEYERWQRRRLNITGGITCIWQVSGRSQIGFREWMRMDMAYVTHHSPWLDLKLLVRTVVAVITGRGAY